MTDLMIDTKKLNILQAERGLTNVKFAKFLGVNPSTLNDIKKGKRQARINTIGKIAEALNVAVSDIVI